MKKLILLICILSFQIFISAQSKIDLAEKAKTIPVNKNNSFVIPKANTSSTEGNIIGYTDYDYVSNNGILKQLDLYDIDSDGKLDPVGTYMRRLSAEANGLRQQVMFYGLENEYVSFPTSGSNLPSGSGAIQVLNAGPWSDHAAIMFFESGKMKLSVISLIDFNSTVDAVELDFAISYPNFCYLDDGKIYAISNDDKLRLINVDNPQTSSETGIEFSTGSSLQPIKRSPNGQYLAVVNANTETQVILHYSSNSGETWSEEVIGENLVNEISNRPNTYPLFTNFGQASYVLDDSGGVHIGMNGYGLHIEDTDTTFAYPALYWNNINREWIAISDPEEEGEELTELYPGNGIGNAYPTPVVSKDGKDVTVIYQAPEYENGVLQIYNGDGTESNFECYYTDIVLSHIGQIDGLMKLGEPHQSEVFPSAYDVIEVYESQTNLGKSWTWYFMYMVDAVPGVSIFGENSVDENSYWKYEWFGQALTDVNENEIIPNKFALLQNYLNPFNPTTTIQFSIPGSQFATLKVYDILGREVKTLVNETKPPGTYEVKFDGSDLSSGTYFYRLTSGNFTQTKKMLLVK